MSRRSFLFSVLPIGGKDGNLPAAMASSIVGPLSIKIDNPDGVEDDEVEDVEVEDDVEDEVEDKAGVCI